MSEKTNWFNRGITYFITPYHFIRSWRSLPLYELLCYVLMFLGVQLLALNNLNMVTRTDLYRFLYFSIALYSGFFATLIWNDISDATIDKIVHPDRPIPSSRIRLSTFFIIAVILSIITFVSSYLVNLPFFIAVILLALFVTFHNKVFKRKIPLPAYSEIFTPFQWSMVPILGFLSINTSIQPSMIILFLFTYFSISAHDIVEGIHDYRGDKKNGVRTFMTSFNLNVSITVSIIWFILSGIFGFTLFFYSRLSPIYLILFILLWIYNANSYSRLRLVKEMDNDKRVKNILKIGRNGYNYFLFTYSIIFFDLSIAILEINPFL